MNILKNIHLKLLAFFAALLLWLFVVGVENYVFTSPIEMSVKVLNLGQNVSLANEMFKVKVKYKSTIGSININPNELELFINAQGLADGVHNLPVEYTNKNPKFTVVAIEPSRLDLKLEAITSKDIVLHVEILGSPAKDYEIKDSQITTEKVKISGASSAIAEINELQVKVSLDGSENADFSRKVTLEPPADWKLTEESVSFDPATVQVDIEIRKKRFVTEVVETPINGTLNTLGSENTPVAEGRARKTVMVQIVPADDLRTSIKDMVPQNILVTVEATPDDLTGLNNSTIKLVMNSSEVQNGSYAVSIKDLVMPEGKDLKVISVSPAKVNVRF